MALCDGNIIVSALHIIITKHQFSCFCLSTDSMSENVTLMAEISTLVICHRQCGASEYVQTLLVESVWIIMWVRS